MQSNEWRPVADYEDIYEVSTSGQIRRVVDSCARAKAGDLITPMKIKNGRLVARLHRNGSKVHRYVHRIVAIAFLGDRPGLEVCHNDGDPTNNHLSNLRWDTHAANMQDMVRHGRSGRGVPAVTHCPQGHEYDAENTRRSKDGKRACRACHRNWAAERRAMRREQ